MKNSAKKKGAKKRAAAVKKTAKKSRLVRKKISKVSGRKKPLVNYDERRCIHVDPDTGEICGEICHPVGGKRKSDGMQIRMPGLCTKHHQENLANRHGKKNYRTLIANNAGLETSGEYLNYIARQAGFEDQYDRMNENAKQAGFEDHYDRLNENAKQAGYRSYSDLKNSKHPYRKYRKDYCENIDGRLGFKCTTEITEDMILAGVLEVDHIIPQTKWARLKAAGIVTGSVNSKEQTQTLCCNCHKMKGWLYEDGNPNSDKYMILETA